MVEHIMQLPFEHLSDPAVWDAVCVESSSVCYRKGAPAEGGGIPH